MLRQYQKPGGINSVKLSKHLSLRYQTLSLPETSTGCALRHGDYEWRMISSESDPSTVQTNEINPAELLLLSRRNPFPRRLLFFPAGAAAQCSCD